MSVIPKTILLIGASRGLGLGLAEAFVERGWSVIATTRGPSPDLEALRRRSEGGLRIERLDINDEAGANDLSAALAETQLDVVFVNAGVLDEKRPVGEVSTVEFTRLMVTNALSPMRMIERFAPLLTPEGVVGAMSSGLGSVESNTSGGYDVYHASKAALNTLLRSYAARNPKRPVLAVAPGWVRTAMGGPGASLSVETSVRGVAEVLISHIGRPGSAFVSYHGKSMPW